MNNKNNNQLKFTNYSGPLLVSLDVTTACNFKCKHCFNDSGCKINDEFTDDEIYDIANQIAELKPLVVCMCGGEPMLRKNIIDLIKCISPHVGCVNIVSNGSLINEYNASQLKKAGIDTIQISLDGINEVQHDNFRGYKGAFKKAIQAIQHCKKVGLNVATSFTPNKLNYRTINEYINLCKELGVNSIRSMPFIPTGRGTDNTNWLLSTEEYLFLQCTLEKRKGELKNTSFSIEWGDPLDHYTRMKSNSELGYKTHAFDIKANGDIKFSSYLPGVVGNLKTHTIKEYWDAGFNDIWSNQAILNYTDNVVTIYDINEVSKTKLNIDLI